MNYPPANLWTQVQIDPAPEAEPQMVLVAVERNRSLSLPVAWSVERREAFIERWLDLSPGELQQVPVWGPETVAVVRMLAEHLAPVIESMVTYTPR